MKKMIILGLLGTLFLLGFSCVPAEELSIVGVMYHHWWVPQRWVDEPRNHPYEALLGHYDNVDMDVIRQHIAWAKESGINTFIINFWITDRDQSWVIPHTDILVDALDQAGLNYFFLVDGWFEFLSAADPIYEIAWRVNARTAPYLNRPGYLKQSDKPVLFFWAASQADCHFFCDLRPAIEGTLGPIFMTGDQWNCENPSQCFDLRMDYSSYYSACDANDYDCQLDHQDHMWQNSSKDRKPWAPTAMAGYDDHYVRPGNPIVPLDADFFKKSIKTALKYPQFHDDNHKWLLICSWNEWHEGSSIEPSSDFEDPQFLLNVLKNELGKE
jgi:hypothetical protein